MKLHHVPTYIRQYLDRFFFQFKFPMQGFTVCTWVGKVASKEAKLRIIIA